jgi:hypothetical protein
MLLLVMRLCYSTWILRVYNTYASDFTQEKSRIFIRSLIVALLCARNPCLRKDHGAGGPESGQIAKRGSSKRSLRHYDFDHE